MLAHRNSFPGMTGHHRCRQRGAGYRMCLGRGGDARVPEYCGENRGDDVTSSRVAEEQVVFGI